MTVLEVIQRSAEFLAKRGVDSPRLQIELLLAHVLQMPRLKLYLSFDRTLSETELAALRELVKRRANREPLQHLVGSTSFCGLEMQVGPHVLIPRPETELLAERAWNYLSALSSESRATAPPTALDLGTGSGCLAISLAVKCPAARVTAVDISQEALTIARQNATANGVDERITFYCGDGLEALPPEARFDLIVTNPPYIPSSEIETLQPEVRDHDPRLALDGGPDGLAFFRRLARDAGARLSGDGTLMAEFGDGQSETIAALFKGSGWRIEGVEPDYSGRSRILIARRAGT